MRRPLLFGTIAALVMAVLSPAAAFAHGFGDRYDLPVPLGLYMGGAGAAIVLSFVIIGLIARGRMGDSYPRHNLLRWRVARALSHPIVLETVKAASAAVFVVYVIAGLFGTREPDQNLVPTMTWVVFWVGIAYTSAFVGNVWALINPWKVLFGYAESAYERLRGVPLGYYEEYPEKLGAWPGVVLFLTFAWVEVVYTDSGVPFDIAVLALGYSAITFAGMWWFGKEAWLRNGEAFSIVFGFMSAFAPTEARVVGEQDEPDAVDDYEAFGEASSDRRELNIRPWGAGLLTVHGLTLSHAGLLVLMLATVSFDGFVETSTWGRIVISWHSGFSFLGAQASVGIATVGLVVAPLIFFGVFAATAWLMGWLADVRASTLELVRLFAMSLVPIALAYHVAHFFSFLAIQGQRMSYLIADPLGKGWDLFGITDSEPNVGIVSARFVWVLSIAAIVIGHVVAVYVAHVYAVRTFAGRGAAVRSQYPMLVLMVAYTMVSLWIVVQPIVVG